MFPKTKEELLQDIADSGYFRYKCINHKTLMHVMELYSLGLVEIMDNNIILSEHGCDVLNNKIYTLDTLKIQETDYV